MQPHRSYVWQRGVRVGEYRVGDGAIDPVASRNLENLIAVEPAKLKQLMPYATIANYRGDTRKQ